MGASSCSREGARMGLAGAAAVAPGTPHLPIHRSLSYCAPCLHPPHTTIRPLTSRGPPPQHLINWAHLWGKRGGNLHWKILGLSPGALHPASGGVHMWGGGIQLAFPPLDSISSGHPRKQAATQGRRGGGLAECSMLSSVGRRTTVVLTTGPLWDQYDARRDVCSPTPHRLTLGALREFKLAPLRKYFTISIKFYVLAHFRYS